ncbi:DUF6691 family protein [Methylotenera sp.]|uniref:DUF6691 family protein n=1 Tax=Methylotenera sp. TaxID=2051956 RepID=UPI00248A51E9|nr:DUF6691 family protein [Methylotenera sp.]MDI1360499.1 YeeE/YedE family protein [Methylotenera sp.]
MIYIISLFSGLVFGLGLIISGMTNPAKVIGFLDVTGFWDPSLGFVMLGAISVAYFSSKIAKKRKLTYTGLPILLPKANMIDSRLIIGSAIFGTGWGLAGYCPGPGITSILTGKIEPILFVIAMVSGMVIYEVLESLKARY